MESLSAYARQFLQLGWISRRGLIEGLSPAISIEQKATSHNPRLTVGTGHRDPRPPAPAVSPAPARRTAPDHPEHALEAQSITQMECGAGPA